LLSAESWEGECVIREKVEINGRVVTVCRVERRHETISTLVEENMGRKKRRKPQTYHAYQPKEKNEEKEDRLKYLLYSLVVSKQRFEAAFLKAKLSLQALRKALGKGDK
jgi:hypothetical protein